MVIGFTLCLIGAQASSNIASAKTSQRYHSLYSSMSRRVCCSGWCVYSPFIQYLILTFGNRRKIWNFLNAVRRLWASCASTDRILVDVAAKERDAHRRIAFVAAFAMSNYSSTIGRIAKPFNPMLVCRPSFFLCRFGWKTDMRSLKSETFEYVRLDKDYRYMSEQVSHHPPISACWAESPHWRYYGEVRWRVCLHVYWRLTYN